MTESEREFFEFYNKVSDVADRTGLPDHQIVSIREVWDYAYAMGEANGASNIANIFKSKESN